MPWFFEVGIITRQVLCSILALKGAHDLGLGQGAMILLSSLFDVHKCKEGALKVTVGWLHYQSSSSTHTLLCTMTSHVVLSAKTTFKQEHSLLRFWVTEKSLTLSGSPRGECPWQSARLFEGWFQQEWMYIQLILNKETVPLAHKSCGMGKGKFQEALNCWEKMSCSGSDWNQVPIWSSWITQFSFGCI